MVSTSSLKPMLSISSASSSTANRTAERSSAPSLRWSMIRPGVPMSTSTPSRSARCCGGYGTPPWKRTVRSRCGVASIEQTSDTWRASSRVGARTTIRGVRPRGSLSPGSCSSASAVMSGSAKASVFPVPVRERPSMSAPPLSRLKDLAWMGVKWVMPLAARTATVAAPTSNDAIGGRSGSYSSSSSSVSSSAPPSALSPPRPSDRSARSMAAVGSAASRSRSRSMSRLSEPTVRSAGAPSSSSSSGPPLASGEEAPLAGATAMGGAWRWCTA
mmetsp:Transcript_44720/g.146658  ORF Transcript_44720/g.146658 Transcript_44720/m.146658 type:complete len:273 (-) Transcript_44720:130-948(-)